MLCATMENTNSSSSHACTTDNVCLRHDTGQADLIALWQNKSIIKRAQPPAPDKEGKRGKTLITTSERMKDRTINRKWINQRGFCFQLDIKSYLVDILETVSWWHLGVVTITAASFWGPTSQFTDNIFPILSGKSFHVMSEGTVFVCVWDCVCVHEA